MFFPENSISEIQIHVHPSPDHPQPREVHIEGHKWDDKNTQLKDAIRERQESNASYK